MYAIIETGGKQYRVQNGDKIAVEKLGVADGETVVFDKVLVVGEGAEAKVGRPTLKALRSREESSRPGRARRWSSSSTRPRRITERSRATDSLIRWLK